MDEIRDTMNQQLTSLIDGMIKNQDEDEDQQNRMTEIETFFNEMSAKL